MKSGTRILSAATAGLVLAVSLSGCSTGAAEPKTIPLPTGVPEDIIMETAGIAKDTPLITVDGKDVPAEELLYWLTSYADQYAQIGMSNMSMDMGEGQTLGEYYMDSAVQTATLYRVVETHAEELKLGWSKENQTSYDEQLATMKTNLATQAGLDIEGDPARVDEEYVRLISFMGLSQQGFYHINQATYLYDNLRTGLYGEGGPEAPDAAKLEEAGILRAKHILISAVPVQDETGNVTDDGMAAALEKANSLYDQLAAAEDPAALFDQLMGEHSEDPGSKSQPDGYTFGPGEMVQEFYDGTKALAVGEISKPVASSYGYHVILRLDADSEEGRSKYTDIKMNEQIDQWMEAAQVEKSEALNNLDVQAFYDGLTALRQSISEAAQAGQTPADTAPPAETGAPAGTPAPEDTTSPAPTATPVG